MAKMLQFDQLTSFVDVGFYNSLATLKIDVAKLDDSARPLFGRYSIPLGRSGDVGRVEIPATALTNTTSGSPNVYLAEGTLKNLNTKEDFATLDRAELVKEIAQKLWNAILDGTIYDRPSLLAQFIVISFADLKKFRFTTLVGFPAFSSNAPWQIDGEVEQLNSEPTADSLLAAIQEWRSTVDWTQHGFFVAKRLSDGTWKAGSLREYEEGFTKGDEVADTLLGFVDPSADGQYPGWVLRNLLVLVRKRWGIQKLRVLSLRDTVPFAAGKSSKSLIFTVTTTSASEDPSTALESLTLGDELPKVVAGWEKNGKKLNIKVADLGTSMDPNQLASSAVDLNLKLIKWRLVPELDLDGIKNTKCLLLGAGTLGSYVSRILLAWGVRKVTFIDNATISYSNPVRQPLFTLKDCIGGKTGKAVRAAEVLKEIFPGVDSSGIEMSVPMIGHPIINESQTKADFEKLEELIDQHDVIFLLMDTRESRWLPTLMGKAKSKIVLTAALGFDSYVVMRHGVSSLAEDPETLGCYFCNDVVAPADSMKDQTLDQQCTVTRPGLAPAASSKLVEILAALLQHPLKGKAKGGLEGSDHNEGLLGFVPHTIRGFLSSWKDMLIRGKAYDCCSACSDRVVDAYKSEGWEFVKKALADRTYVEEVSGLAQMKRDAETAGGWGDSDADDDSWGSEGDAEEMI